MPALHYADVLKRPIITEKTTDQSTMGQYVFEVAMEANKRQIKDAVEMFYDVEVEAVNTMVVKPRRRRVYRSRMTPQFGSTSAYKKAIVTVVPGDTIDLFGDI